jgi:hypothetical protein
MVNYELLRNLLITSKLNASWNDYEVIDRHDSGFGASLGVNCNVSRAVTLGLTYSRQQRASSGAAAGLGFDDDVVSFALTLRR